MEPWQEERLQQLLLDKKKKLRPGCHCCGEPVDTELFLDLGPFGIRAYGCENCVRIHMHSTDYEFPRE